MAQKRRFSRAKPKTTVRKTSRRRSTSERPKREIASPSAGSTAAAATGPARRPGYELSPDAVERALRAGTDVGLLEDYFGETEYRALRELSLEASARARGGPRVLILPGIMGSTLGFENRLGPFDDVLWFDPLDVSLGKLPLLAPGAEQRIVPLGVILFAYLKLKLKLQRAGYDADFYPFDWRASIDELGAELARRISGERDGVQLVAHSMGGLVARAALKHASGAKVRRLIQLGTPNHGSFVPIQAIRGTSKTARALAALDLRHSVEELSEKLFRTLPGLSHMFPSPERFKAVNVYAREGWPSQGPLPSFEILRKVARVRDKLASADSRFFLVAGVNQETPVGLTLSDREFVYEYSSEGDGTVPLALATLTGAKTYYVDEEHGALANNGEVAAAVLDLLATGSTRVLPDTRPPVPRRSTRRVSDTELLQRPPFDGRRGGELSSREVRHAAAEFVAPTARGSGLAVASAPLAGGGAAAGAVLVQSFEGLVVGRRRQRQLEIRVARGSIVAARARAYVLGVYKGVEPAGPAAAVDAALEGAIKEFVTRRMFSANAGEVFAVPTSGYLLQASTVLLAGLGSFDQFNSEVQQLVAENVARTFVRTGIDDFATVLFGTGSGHDVATAVYNYLAGTFRALKDGRANVIRRITLCELDPTRFAEMKTELLRLTSTQLFEDIHVTFEEVELPAPVEPPRARRPVLEFEHPVAYLHVRREPGQASGQAFRSTVLTAGSKATVISGVREVSATKLRAQLATIAEDRLTFQNLREFGAELARLMLSEDVLQVLNGLRDYHLVVVHDAEASRVPWETLCIPGSGADDWFPARDHGLSRRYMADNMSVSKWLEERRTDRVLNILLVTNPTEDLDGADREAARLKALFAAERDVRIDELAHREATKPALLAAFRSGEYDVLHYAGHAFFDETTPSLSGILCANDQVLAGAELANLSRLPSLVFFNACEAARIRKKRGSTQRSGSDRSGALRPIQQNVGLAEAFLRGGVPNYVGTYWPVGDAAAEKFASEFYRTLLQGQSIGAALNRSRAAVHALKQVDWANYVLYGACDFRVKLARES